MIVKSKISLTCDQDAFVRSLVKTGGYDSVSSVVQQALELLRQRLEEEELETAALQELIECRRHGPFISSAEMWDRLSVVIESKRRASEAQR